MLSVWSYIAAMRSGTCYDMLWSLAWMELLSYRTLMSHEVPSSSAAALCSNTIQLHTFSGALCSVATTLASHGDVTNSQNTVACLDLFYTQKLPILSNAILNKLPKVFLMYLDKNDFIWQVFALLLDIFILSQRPPRWAILKDVKLTHRLLGHCSDVCFYQKHHFKKKNHKWKHHSEK